MTFAGIEITDTDSLDAAADIVEDAESWLTCEECNGTQSIVDYSPGLGWINIECPACDGQGSVLDLGDDYDGDDWDPEPFTQAAPSLPVVVAPDFRQPLWAALLEGSAGRVAQSAADSREARRRRRAELDRAA